MNNKLSKVFPTIVIATSSLTPLVTITNCSKTDLYTQLTQLSSVVKVEKLEQKEDFKERFMIWFKQPLDWKDASKGSFEQRVELDFRGYDKMNQIFTSGYEIRDLSEKDLINNAEIAKRYSGNVIQIEYRFFEQSKPKDLDVNNLKYWEYLTNNNAVNDFHKVITLLKTILKGKWALTGSSKGGETANVFAMHFPKDCDAYVPYVAPRFYKRNDDTLTKRVYTDLGDDVLGKTICDQWRKEIFDLQYYLLKNRDTVLTKTSKNLVETLWDSAANYKYSQYAMDHHDYMYDLCVEELITGFWQYDQKIDDIKKVNAMTDGQDKLLAAINLLIEENSPSSYAVNEVTFPYHLQAAREMGEYNYDFSFMITALQNACHTDVESYIKVPSSERKDFYWKIILSDVLYQKWYVQESQDLTVADQLIEWNKTCKVPVFMIYGGADPWYTLRLDETVKSDKIQVFVGKSKTDASGRSHRTRITMLNESDRNKVWAELDKIFK